MHKKEFLNKLGIFKGKEEFISWCIKFWLYLIN